MARASCRTLERQVLMTLLRRSPGSQIRASSTVPSLLGLGVPGGAVGNRGVYPSMGSMRQKARSPQTTDEGKWDSYLFSPLILFNFNLFQSALSLPSKPYPRALYLALARAASSHLPLTYFRPLPVQEQTTHLHPQPTHLPR